MKSAEGRKFVVNLKRWLVRERLKHAYRLVCVHLAWPWLLELIRSKPGMALRIQCAWRRKAAYLHVARIHYWRRFTRVMNIKLIACKHFVSRYKVIHAARIEQRENDAKKAEIRRKKLVDLKARMEELRDEAGDQVFDLPPAGGSRMVPLLASVQKHRTFKQLLNKSIDSVTAALNPSLGEYQENLDDCVRFNGPAFIVNIMCYFAGEDGDVFAACARCLTRMAKDPTMAEQLAMNSALLLMRTDAEMYEAEDQWLAFIEEMCVHCAAEVVAMGGVDIVMEAAEKSEKMFNKCMRTLEMMAATPEGGEAIEKGGGIELILKTVKPSAPSAVLASAFKFLDQFAQSFAENQLGRITALVSSRPS
jgi:hypothetical protein